MLVRPRSTTRAATRPVTNAFRPASTVPLSRTRIEASLPRFRFSTQQTPRLDINAHTDIIQKLGNEMDMKKAQKQYRAMLADGVQPTVAVFNALLTGFSKLHDKDSFGEVWKQMQAKGIKPNPRSYALFMELCLELGQYENVEALHARLLEDGLQPDADVYAVLMRMNGEAGYVDDTQKLMQEMVAHGIKPEERHFISLMHANLLHEDVDDAVSVFNRMKAEGVTPTSATYYLFLKSLQGEASLMWLEAFEATGQHVPDAFYMAAIETCHSMNDTDRATHYIEKMRTLKIQ